MPQGSFGVHRSPAEPSQRTSRSPRGLDGDVHDPRDLPEHDVVGAGLLHEGEHGERVEADGVVAVEGPPVVVGVVMAHASRRPSIRLGADPLAHAPQPLDGPGVLGIRSHGRHRRAQNAPWAETTIATRCGGR